MEEPLSSIVRDRGGPMDNRTLPERIAAEMRLAILRGELPAGQPLRQRELAARYGTSLIPVREALRSLERENLVTTSAYRGAAVLPIGVAELQECIELHGVLLEHVLTHALPLAQPGDADRLARILDQLEATDDPVHGYDLLWAFHAALLLPAQRPCATEMLRFLWLRYLRYWPIVWRLLRERSLEAPSLREVVASYRRGDAPEVLDALRRRHEGFAVAFADEMRALECAEPAASPARRPRARRTARS